ncbi:hypothetical protein FGB62_75g010 [Gracilaria domingensis]|nr:hypothetical protein FGB62_75g010 [Gracilaria domingensis]
MEGGLGRVGSGVWSEKCDTWEGRGEEAREIEQQMGKTVAVAGAEELGKTDRRAEAAAHPEGRNTAQDHLGGSDSEVHSTRMEDQC